MPIYEFRCEKCGHEFEQLVKQMAETNVACPQCQGKTKRRLSVFAAHAHSGEGACGQREAQCGMSGGGCCPGSSCPMAQR